MRFTDRALEAIGNDTEGIFIVSINHNSSVIVLEKDEEITDKVVKLLVKLKRTGIECKESGHKVNNQMIVIDRMTNDYTIDFFKVT